MSNVQVDLIFDEGAQRPGEPLPHGAALVFEDRGDVDSADYALRLARPGLRRVSDWLADLLRRGESAARWALLLDDLGRNHTVRAGIVRGEEVSA